jgi:carbonic anhydrase/acetyltransferase-like protein (isoleucine patch superfamily)
MGTLGRAVYKLGYWVRETGQALDRLGLRLQGEYGFKEQISRHRTIMPFYEKKPQIGNNVFVAPSAAVIGDVSIGHKSSIWYGTVLRGDVNSISIGSETNIQDNTLVHVAKTNVSGNVAPTFIGDRVTVGHNAVLHACTVEDEVLVGMGATLLDGVVVEKGAIVAAGALVTQNTRVPAGQIWAGSPAKFLRNLSGEERSFLAKSADNYAHLGAIHAEENGKSFSEIEGDKEFRKKLSEHSDDYDSHLGIIREKERPSPAEHVQKPAT